MAAYVAHVAAIPGVDGGQLADIGAVKQKPATEQNGKPPDRRGSQRPAEVPCLERERDRRPDHDQHEERIERSPRHRDPGNGVSQVGKVVQNGGTSTVSENLKPGTYTFYCSVDGHEAAGMKGTLTVK